MSPNNNQQDNNIVDEAREFVHDTVQTDREREQIEQGKKPAVQRGWEKVEKTSPVDAAASVANKIDEATNKERDDKTDKDAEEGFLDRATETTKKGIQNARQALTNVTRSEEEKELIDKAKKTVSEKAADELDEGLRSATRSVKNTTQTAKSTIGSATENAKKQASAVEDETRGQVEKVENAVQSKTGDGTSADNSKEPDFVDKAMDKVMSWVGDKNQEPQDNNALEGNRVSEETLGEGMKQLGKSVEDKFRDKEQETYDNDSTENNRVSEETLGEGMKKLGKAVEKKSQKALDDMKGKLNSQSEDPSDKPKNEDSNSPRKVRDPVEQSVV